MFVGKRKGKRRCDRIPLANRILEKYGIKDTKIPNVKACRVGTYGFASMGGSGNGAASRIWKGIRN